jgi:preprotein translocase subunit YajC/predicted Ser/Thr protein kinase
VTLTLCFLLFPMSVCLPYLLLIGILWFLLSLSAAQQQIVQTTATLSVARADLVATSSGDVTFFGGGAVSLTTSTGQVDLCNVTSGSWTAATLSFPRQDLAAASSKILALFGGGDDGSKIYAQVDIYNTSDGSWRTAALSQPRSYLAATAVGNLVLFGGGVNSTGPSEVVDIYDATSSTWTATTLSQARWGLAATSVGNRYALFAGGYGFNFSNVIDIYDALNGTWATATLSQARKYAVATSLGNFSFIGGGEANNQSSNVINIFNSAMQTWSTATLSQARYYLAAAAVGDVVAFGGGTPNSQTPSAVVDMYNMTSNTWFTTTLSEARALLAATSATNKIFFGGGLSSSGLSNVVDVFCIGCAPAPLPTPTNAPGVNSNTKSVVVGVVVGILVPLLVLALILFLFFYIKRKKQKAKQPDESAPVNNAAPEQMTDTTYRPISKSQNLSEKEPKSLSRQSSMYESTVELTTKSFIPFEEIEVGEELGRGSYGKVRMGRWNDVVVALKFCKKKGKIDDFFKEINLMTALPSHPNVVQVFGVCMGGPQPILVMEYCSGGSLDRLLFDSQKQLDDKDKIHFAKGIARGMLHLHNHNIVHRDLAARNILLSGHSEPKISDFGMSRVLQQEDEGKTETNIGPIRWMAPESLAQQTYSKKSDVWTFGIVVYEIVARREPHTDVNLLDIGPLIRDKALTPKIPEDCPTLLRDIMEKCWKPNPDERPSFKEIYLLFKEETPRPTSDPN